MKIDWDDIKISFVPADKDCPNELNPYAKSTAKDREQAIISISGRIWARAVKERLLEQKIN